MKKSMNKAEMKRVVGDLIAKYGKEKAIEKIKLKIEFPEFGVSYCFLCHLYRVSMFYENRICGKCPYDKIGCLAIKDKFRSTIEYEIQRKIDYIKMKLIAKG